jgi:hypothetical protein
MISGSIAVYHFCSKIPCALDVLVKRGLIHPHGGRSTVWSPRVFLGIECVHASVYVAQYVSEGFTIMTF